MPNHFAAYLLAGIAFALLTRVCSHASGDQKPKTAAAAGGMLMLAALVAAAQVHAATNNTGEIPLQLVEVKSPVARGDHGHLVAALFPERPRCTISVEDKNGQHTNGLNPRRPAIGGRLAWTWKVRAHAALGRSRILVDCGTAGALRTRFTVIP